MTRAATREKYAQINRRILPRELGQVLDHAQAAGLWRFDRRWRKLVPGHLSRG